MAHYGADKSDLDKLRNVSTSNQVGLADIRRRTTSSLAVTNPVQGVAHAIEEFIGGKHKREKVAT